MGNVAWREEGNYESSKVVKQSLVPCSASLSCILGMVIGERSMQVMPQVTPSCRSSIRINRNKSS